MPYYHMYIVMKENGEKRHFLTKNLSEEKLIEIAKSRKENKPFGHSGRVYDPSAIDKITVFKSDKKFRDLVLSNGTSLPARSARVVAKLLQGRDVAGVSIVTNRYIKGVPNDKLTRKTEKPIDKKRIFIVHGTDHDSVRELKLILKELGLQPIILHEQASGSRTIIEKLEKYSDVGYVFVILTPDDIGVSFQDLFEKTAKSSYEDEALGAAKRILEQSRGSIERFLEFNNKFMQDPADASKFLQFLIPCARQNVVLEFGYFMGLLGRDRVCCLYKGDVKLPSDMHGIVYLPFEKSVNEAKSMILKELREAGYEIKSP